MTVGFFEPLRSRVHALALSDILEISPIIKRATGDEYHLIRMRGEIGQVEAYRSEVAALMERPIQLLPASPGMMLLYVGVDEDEAWVTRDPLIAWALCMDGQIRPVTPAGVDDGGSSPSHGWFVEAPGLGIRSCGDTGYENSFENEGDLLAAVKRWEDQRDPAPAEGGDA